MLLNVPDQLRDAFALVIARALVMDIPTGALTRIRLRTVGRQEQQLDARMRRKPPLDRLRLVNAVVVHNHLDCGELRFRVQLLQTVQQRPEQYLRLTYAHAMHPPARSAAPAPRPESVSDSARASRA